MQFYHATVNTPFHKYFKSQSAAAANICCLNEWYTIDTLSSNLPAADDTVPGHGRCTMAQSYMWACSCWNTCSSTPQEIKMVNSGYLGGFHSKKWSHVWFLFSDSIKSKLSTAVKDIHNACILFVMPSLKLTI